MSLIQAEPDIQDSPEVRRIEKAKNTHMAVDGLPNNIQKIQFHDVGFRYDVGDDILRHIDLTINQGETLAIVGSTGGGKSTLISLLADSMSQHLGISRSMVLTIENAAYTGCNQISESCYKRRTFFPINYGKHPLREIGCF